MNSLPSFFEVRVSLSLFLLALLCCGQIVGGEYLPAKSCCLPKIEHDKNRHTLQRFPEAKDKLIAQKFIDPSVSKESLQNQIDSLVAPYLNSSNFSGEILAAQNGNVLFNKGYGLANYEHSVPVSSQTKFYIASISKSFTAASILLLQERGKLTVNDPVSRFISNFTNGEQITINHLLTHTSGIADSLRFPDFFELSKRPYTTEEAVKLFQNKPLMFKPGEKSNYSNSNYVLLAYIIEKVSGQTYGEFLKTNFLIPMGMTGTGMANHSNELITGLASGYSPAGFNEFETARYFDRSIMTGAGSLYSTAGDLNKWVEGLLAGRVLKKSSVEQMYKGSNSYSWNLTNLWNRDVIIENGWDGAGFAATLMHFINENITVVVLTNLNISSVAGELATGVSGVLLKEKAAPLKINPKVLSDESARKLAGKYKLGDDFFVAGTVLEIVGKDGKLFEQQHNPDRLMGLIPLSDLEFIHRSSWGRMKFEINEKGDVTGMFFYVGTRRFNAIKLPER